MRSSCLLDLGTGFLVGTLRWVRSQSWQACQEELQGPRGAVGHWHPRTREALISCTLCTVPCAACPLYWVPPASSLVDLTSTSKNCPSMPALIYCIDPLLLIYFDLCPLDLSFGMKAAGDEFGRTAAC